VSNVAALRFVKQLIAAFSRFKPSEETKNLYGEKLSKWKLTQSQWDNALDRLIADRAEENLPSLGEIYPYLKNSQQQIEQTNLGWMSFERNCRHYSVRVMCVKGEWLNAPMAYTDAHGQKISVQKFPGQKPILPADSENIIISPDNPADPEPHEILSKEQVAAVFQNIRDGFKLVSSRAGSDPFEEL